MIGILKLERENRGDRSHGSSSSLNMERLMRMQEQACMYINILSGEKLAPEKPLGSNEATRENGASPATSTPFNN
jgi:hypothetical protein